jgi:hypothetical protein
MKTSATTNMANGAGPMPETKLAVGVLADATTIQALALPAAEPMWR